MHILGGQNEAYFVEKLQKNEVVVKLVLVSNCKRYRDTPIRKNFNLKPET